MKTIKASATRSRVRREHPYYAVLAGLTKRTGMPQEVVNQGDEKKRWHQRGFVSKSHMENWLSFNDLIEEHFTYDDVYMDEYTGKVVDVTAPTETKSSTNNVQ